MSNKIFLENLCETSSNVPGISRMHKVLSKTNTNRIELLRQRDGTMTEAGKDSPVYLAQTHFPKSIVTEPKRDSKVLVEDRDRL